MTRKDYVAIAKAIDYLGSQADGAEFFTLRNVVDELSEVFKQDNPRFDAEKFKIACGAHNVGWTS